VGGTFFGQTDLEDRLNETVTEPSLPESIPLEPQEPPTLKEHYIEIGKEIRQDFYDSDFGQACNELYDKLDIQERLDLLSSSLGGELWSLLKDYFSGIDFQQIITKYNDPILSMGAFAGGSIFCYVTNIKR